jgi:hypothetical protein
MGTPASATIATLVPAKGGGGCPSSSTSGVALVTWADRSTTIISYTTQDIGAAVTLNGKVLPSYKVRKKVYRTTRGKDYNPYGYLVFGASPVECAGAGVTTATIAGVAGLQRNS